MSRRRTKPGGARPDIGPRADVPGGRAGTRRSACEDGEVVDSAEAELSEEMLGGAVAVIQVHDDAALRSLEAAGQSGGERARRALAAAVLARLEVPDQGDALAEQVSSSHRGEVAERVADAEERAELQRQWREARPAEARELGGVGETLDLGIDQRRCRTRIEPHHLAPGPDPAPACAGELAGESQRDATHEPRPEPREEPP